MIEIAGTSRRVWPKAVVTGAGGFIGRHLASLLREQGMEVICIDCIASDGVDMVRDLRQSGALDSLLDGDTVLFHLAGSADVRGSVAAPVADFADNVVTAINILETARFASCRVVFPSTGSVYDPAAPLPFCEDSPLRPRSPYAAAKLSVEAYCHAYHRSYGLDVSVARIFSVIGPGVRRLAIHDFVKRLEADPRRLVLWGDGGQMRDYLHVRDVARALHFIALRVAGGEACNVASGRSRTMREVAEGVVTALGLQDCVIATDGQVSDVESYRMEASIAKLQAGGFAPEFSFDRALAETVAWLRQDLRAIAAP
jgi:UDP-glucose 4-epimerase